MKDNTCILVDVCETQADTDAALLKAAGVSGMGIRINRVVDSHQADPAFANLWAAAGAAGLVRFPFFFYNPTMDGAANYAWLAANIPAEAKSVAVDIEVIYPNYAVTVYADEVKKFVGLCQARWRTILYTGQWFLKYLSTWPNIDYWWAQWPTPGSYAAADNLTWADLKSALDHLDRPFNASAVPGRLKMWQFSSDHFSLPGSSKHLNLNLFYGSAQELESFFGNKPTDALSTVDTVTVPPARPLWYVVDDLWPGGNPPYLRIGLPCTKLLKGGTGNVNIPDAWMNYINKMNPTQTAYLWKDASGWHNTGNKNNVRQITFGGNVVSGKMQNGQLYIDTFFTNQTPPTVIPPLYALDNPDIHTQYFTAQYRDHLDMSTSGRWPRILLLANPGEKLWMRAIDVVPYTLINSDVTVTAATLTVNANPNPRSSVGGRKTGGSVLRVYATVPVGNDIWGRVGIDAWIALKTQGVYSTDWRG